MATVEIPGDVYVEYTNGEVQSVKFLPHAHNPDVFGETTAVVWGSKSPDPAAFESEFWTAMARAIGEHGTLEVEWVEEPVLTERSQ